MGIIDLLKDIPISAILREKIIDLESENKAIKLENESLEIKRIRLDLETIRDRPHFHAS